MNPGGTAPRGSFMPLLQAGGAGDGPIPCGYRPAGGSIELIYFINVIYAAAP